MSKQKAFLKETKKDLLQIDVRLIDVESGFNIREDFGDIKSLARDIEENGVRVPLRGRRDGERFILTDGERRYRACQILIKEGKEFRVPFILEPRGINEEDRLIDMFSMNSGKNLTMLEMANGVSRFLKMNYSIDEIANKIAKTKTFVSNCITILEAPKSIKELIKNKKITPTLVLDIFRKYKFDEAVSMMEEISEKMNSIEEGEQAKETETNPDRKKGLSDLLATPKSKKNKITAKTINAKNNHHNTTSIFRKLAKAAEKSNRLIKDEKAIEYYFLKRFVHGTISKKEMEDYFYI